GGPAPSLPPALGFLRLSESSRVTGDGRRVAVVTAVWPPLRGAINYQLKWRRAGGAWSVQVVPDTASSWDVDPARWKRRWRRYSPTARCRHRRWRR
ncbi:hypothetical protein, partial [Chromobacterium sphagni]|uniref:hypothetical protein n=1 Tax=Chromobacterium sphagni TaxID=1903179 RepID=UPI0013010E8E